MEPHVAVITRQSFSRPAAMLREAGYFVTKVTPEQIADCADVEALIVDLRLFDLLQWMEAQQDEPKQLIIAPGIRTLAESKARVMPAGLVEDDLISAVDRMVADRRTAAQGVNSVTRVN